jgi:hypothetical protein
MINRENGTGGVGTEKRVRFTARLTPGAYEAIIQLQQEHRKQEDRALPMWRILDSAVKHYAREKGIQIDGG